MPVWPRVSRHAIDQTPRVTDALAAGLGAHCELLDVELARLRRVEVALHAVAAAVDEAQDLVRALINSHGVERFVLGRLLLALRAPLAEAPAARPRQDAAELLTSEKRVFYLIILFVPCWSEYLYADA